MRVWTLEEALNLDAILSIYQLFKGLRHYVIVFTLHQVIDLRLNVV